METLSHTDILSLNHAIGQIYAARDMESFFRSMFGSIQSIIPGELCSYNETNSRSRHFSKVTTASQDHSNVTQKLLPELNAHLHEHPLICHGFSGKVVKTTDYASTCQFKDTAIYNEYYRHLDIEMQIAVSIPVSRENVSLLALSRNNTDFTERDRLILTLLQPHILNAVRNIAELDSIRLERDLMQRGAPGQGVVLFRADGTIVCISPFAAEMISKYFNAAIKEHDTLPTKVLEWLDMKKNTPAPSRAKNGVQRIEREPLTIDSGECSLTIKFLTDVATGDYVLFISETDTSLLLRNLQDYGLSKRETEVLKWLSKGKTNAEIAVILCMSKRTADKHLEHIFTKLGVESRAAAAAIMGKYILHSRT